LRIARDPGNHVRMKPEVQQNILPVPPERVQTDAAQTGWGVVATIRGPLPDIAAWAAHHLDIGASRLFIYLDEPEPAQIDYLSAHPQIDVTACDDAYWSAQPTPRHETHQRRQMYNANHAYNRCDLNWLAHIDVDEFILPPRPMAQILAGIPADIAYVNLPPVERLAPPPNAAHSTDYFKRTPRMAGQTKAVLPHIYPTFGAHLRGGYISHLEGKIIARTGLPGARVGIHALLHRRQMVTNKLRLDDTLIGHAHAPSWQVFEKHLKFRMTKGSYQKRGRTGFRLLDVLEFLIEEEGETALRRFYTEVCEARPELIEKLAEYNMLVTHPLDLQRKIAEVFGQPPQAIP